MSALLLAGVVGIVWRLSHGTAPGDMWFLALIPAVGLTGGVLTTWFWGRRGWADVDLLLNWLRTTLVAS